MLVTKISFWGRCIAWYIFWALIARILKALVGALTAGLTGRHGIGGDTEGCISNIGISNLTWFLLRSLRKIARSLRIISDSWSGDGGGFAEQSSLISRGKLLFRGKFAGQIRRFLEGSRRTRNRRSHLIPMITSWEGKSKRTKGQFRKRRLSTVRWSRIN